MPDLLLFGLVALTVLSWMALLRQERRRRRGIEAVFALETRVALTLSENERYSVIRALEERQARLEDGEIPLAHPDEEGDFLERLIAHSRGEDR